MLTDFNKLIESIGVSFRLKDYLNIIEPDDLFDNESTINSDNAVDLLKRCVNEYPIKDKKRLLHIVYLPSVFSSPDNPPRHPSKVVKSTRLCFPCH